MQMQDADNETVKGITVEGRAAVIQIRRQQTLSAVIRSDRILSGAQGMLASCVCSPLLRLHLYLGRSLPIIQSVIGISLVEIFQFLSIRSGFMKVSDHFLVMARLHLILMLQISEENKVRLGFLPIIHNLLGPTSPS